MYDEKFKKYSNEREQFAKAILDRSETTIYDLEIKSAAFELSQEGRAVNLLSENKNERILIGMVFGPLTGHREGVKFELKENV